MPAKAPDSHVENAITAYLAGESAQKVAPRFGVCGKRLIGILRERGLLRTKRESFKLTPNPGSLRRHTSLALPDEEIAKRFMAGESVKSLSISFGVTRAAINTSLRWQNVTARSIADAMRLRSTQIPLTERETLFSDRRGPRIQPMASALSVAKGRQRNLNPVYVSSHERLLADWMVERGINIVPQQAVGTYNIDIGAYPVAVEVWGGAWHFSRDHRERIKYLFDSGWNLVIVFVNTQTSPLTVGAADYIVSYFQESASNPTLRGEYRVIWGEGNLFARGGADSDEFTRIVPRRSIGCARP